MKKNYELSILIPSRSEMFLKQTIEDALKNIEADTEIIAVLDGEWAKPAVPQHDRVNVIYTGKSIGQRAATNLAAKLSKAKYLMKVDAHCSFDKGFDRKMIEAFKETGDNVTMVPLMRNLWAYDWKCYHCGKRVYQSATPDKCEGCGKSDKLRRKIVWIGKDRPQSTSYCFDAVPHFQYFNDYRKRPEYKKAQKETGLTETMGLQGSCFMCTRDNYWKLKLSDEEFGNWGNQGVELSCKTWLSGGKVICNQNTWYAHMFRKGGDFGFPWPNSGNETARTKAKVRKQVWLGKLPHQKHPLSWLIERFAPIPGWTDEDIKKLKDNEKK